MSWSDLVFLIIFVGVWLFLVLKVLPRYGVGS